jgi:murein DD-endopeptidase MepM/ murein hydrolase activator NlpD
MSPAGVLLLVRRSWSWGIALVVLATTLAPSAWGSEHGLSKSRKGAVAPKRSREHPPRDAREEGIRHPVRPGDTLWSVARRHGVEVEALARANRLAPGARLRVGQQLVIPTAVMASDSQEPPSPAEIVLEHPPRTDGAAFAWPLVTSVASPFGPRGRSWHGGVDLRAERGTPIRAAAPGMVVASTWERGYGNVVKIWHSLDFMTVYAHNHQNLVQVGDWVERGQMIATVGSTGRTTAPHLHFEIRYAGRKYDPLFWLPQPGTFAVASSGRRAESEPE